MIVDIYTIVGSAALVAIAGLVGFRLLRDERLLHRKMVLSEKY